MRRQAALLTAFLLATASIAIAAVIDHEVAITTRGIEYPLAASALPARVHRLGVNADLLQYEPDVLAQQLSRMQSVGIRWVRQIVSWRDTEPAPSAFNWARWDIIFQTAAQYPELSIVPVFFKSPRWASADHLPDHPTLPPQNPADFAAFASAFAQRYGDQIDYYQLWDEPNLYDAWGETPPSAAHYVAMVAAAAAAIRAVDPSAQIIAAALAPTTEDNQRNISDWSYLRQIYALGISQHVDAFAAKPYGFNGSPLDRTVSHNQLNFSRVVALREIMRAHDDHHKALWFSEWGWNTLPTDWRGAPSIWGQVNQATQVQYTLEALARIEAEWPFVGGALLSEWQPNRPLDDPRWGFALLTPADEASPLLQALQASPQRTLPSNGFFPPTISTARYSGLWTFGALGADIGWLETSDSQLEFQFYGRDVGLMVRQGDFIAYLYPSVEGFQANALQIDSSGNPYILLRSESQRPEITPVPIATNLPLQAHTLRVVADRGWDQWVLVGYLVSDGDMVTPLHQLRTVAWGVAVASVIALFSVAFSVRSAFVSIQRVFSGTYRRLQRPIAWVIGGAASLLLMIGLLLSIVDGVPLFLRRDAASQLAAIILTGGLLAFEWPAVLVMSACGALFIIFYARPIIGITLTLFYAPFFLFPVELFRFAFPLAELLLLLTAAAAGTKSLVVLARRYQGSVSQFPLRLHIRWHPFDALVGAFLALGIFAFLISENRAAALTEFRTLIVEPAVLYVLIRAYVMPHQPAVLLRALLASAALVCIIGIAYFITGTNVITAEEGARRLASVYGSPNNVALLLIRSIPIALALAYCARRRWRSLYTSMLGLFLLTLLLTQSTGGLLLGLPAGLAAFFLLQYGKRAWLPLMAIAIFFVAFAAIAAQLSPRFASLLDFTEGTNFIRLRLWESSVAMIQDYPLTGIGLDQFLERYRGTYVKPDAIWDSQLNHPHNLVLDFWLRLGIGGVIWLVGLVGLIMANVQHLMRSLPPQSCDRHIVVGIAAALAGSAAHGLVDNSLFVVDLALIFWAFLGILAHLQHPATPK